MAAPIDRRLLRESAVARTHLALAGALGVLGAGLIVAQAALLAYVIDHAALERASVAALQPQLIALTAVLLARAVTSGAFELSGRLGAQRVMSELRARLGRHLLLNCPSGHPGEARTGELATAAVQGVDALESWFAGYLPQLVIAALVPLAVLGWTASVDPAPAAILALTVPILVVFMILIGKRAQAQTSQRWRALALLSSHFLDVVRGLPTLRAHRREHAQARILADVGERYRRETLATLRVAFLSALVLELCATIGTALVAATIGVQLAGGYLSLTAGLTVLLLAPELYGPLRGVGQQFHASADGTAAAERIFAVLDTPPLLAGRAGPPRTGEVGTDERPARKRVARLPDPAHQPIRLQGVRYEYPGRPEAALERLELELAPGEITALVGPSGAGKSTVARLLMRLADPCAGRVTCGGVDLRELDAEAWRTQIAWVPQRAQIFAGTVAENIRLGAPDAEREQVRDTAASVGALGFIEALPQGMETVLGEGGRRLSAGQRQRIALARALLRDARLLVLDEPTANLDERSTRQIAAALPALARGRTTLLIVHHAVLAEHADRVLRMRDGRLVRASTHGRQLPQVRSARAQVTS